MGIDLAAREKNPTGVAIMEGNSFTAFNLFSDSEILDFVENENPQIVAIDAPMTLQDRYAEKYLKKYGAMSLKVPGIRALAKRGLKLREELRNRGFEVIEVFPTATAKILGFYRRPKIEMLHYFSNFRINGARNEHEVDAIIAAYTAYLYVLGKCRSVDGVVIPEENL